MYEYIKKNQPKEITITKFEKHQKYTYQSIKMMKKFIIMLLSRI